jgi:hypothetical protein
MSNSRFLVQFSIEDSVEVLLPEDATEAQIDAAAKAEIFRQIRASRGGGFDVEIGRHEGPY